MSAYKNIQIQTWIKQLSDAGYDLIRKAFLEADFDKNKTQNLRDSYGSAVYYDGRLVPGTKRFFVSKALEGKYNPYTHELETGRQEISSFLDEYKNLPGKLELVIAVAMFYGSILENGSGNLRHKYKVISSVADDIEKLASQYKGTVRKL